MHAEVKIGQYVLVRKLGEGGMAEVWEARHIHLGSSAAVKFLLPSLAGDPELEDRFLNEGKRQARLQHPNIVQAIDFIQQNGRSYLIMQYVDGENLEAKLKEESGPLPLSEVHTISWDILSALDYAHSLGVVHRDVKPSNILLDRSGRVWLSDFGIALALSEEPRLTRTGTAIGTAIYMSPEQIVRPREVDRRADIYSFGCVLYAMLCGSPPFGTGGETDFYIKDCHVRTSPPPLIYRNPAISPALEQVALKCLEKDPAKRFQSCGAAMSALDAAISGEAGITPAPFPPPPAPAPVPLPVALQTPSPSPTPVPSPSPVSPKPAKKRGWILIAVTACLLLAAAVGGYRLFAAPPETVLRLEGSTTVGDALAPAMLKAFLANEGATAIEEVAATGDNKQHRDVRAKLRGSWRPVVFSVMANGSPNAFKALAAGQADIGMASRPVNDSEAASLANVGDMRSPSCENILALDGIAVIVNRGNQLPPLTRQQLNAIFHGTTDNWSQVGGRSGPIHLYGRTSDSGTFDTFVSLVMGGDKKGFAPGLKAEANGDDIARDVNADPYAIGYVGLAQIGGTNALEISGGPGATPLVPSSFTVSTEDYILSRRLFLYTPAKTTEFARKFITFALSPEGQKVVKDVGFVEQTPHFEQVEIPAQAPSAYRSRVNGLRRMNLNFRFRPNSTVLDNKALADVPRMIAALSQNGIRSGVQVLGFADSRGTPAQNQTLSEQRARVVAEKLRANGIEVEVTGFSSAMPVGDNSTEDGRDKNRRVEVWVR
jgi:phosphate transport system substrate-binding protein